MNQDNKQNIGLEASLRYLLSQDDAEQRARWYQQHSFDKTLIEALKAEVEFYRSEDHRTTRIAGERAFEVSQYLDDDARALGHWTYALALTTTGDFEQALTQFETARKLYQQLHAPIDAARVAIRQMQVLATLGQHQAALDLGQQSRQVFTREHLSHELAKVEVNTGIIFSILGQAERSREALLRALPLMEAEQDKAGIAATYVNLGYSYQDQDLFEQAETNFQQALQRFEELQQPRAIAGTKVNIALLYRRQGKLAEALSILAESQQLYQTLTDDPDADLARLEQARVSLALNLLPEAELLASELIDSFTQRLMQVEANEAREVLAKVMVRTSRHQQAHKLWREVQENWLQIDNTAQAALAHLVLLRLRLETAPYGSLMLQELESLIRRLAHHDMPLEQAYALCLLAQLHLKQDRLSLANDVLAEAKGINQRLQNDSLSAHIAWHSGRLAQQQGDLSDAEAHYQQALESYQQQQDQLHQDDLKASFIDDKTALFDDYLSLLLQQQAYEQAFLFIGQSKARLLLDRTSSHEQSQPQQFDHLESIQAALAADTQLLEYLVVHQQLYVFSLTHDSFACHYLGQLSDVEEHLAQFHFFSQRLIQGGMYHQIYSHEQLQQRLSGYLEKLYQQLLAAIERPSAIKQLVIVPHAALHRLPFVALFDGQHYLCETHAICVVPNRTLYLGRKKPKNLKEPSIAAFGPALHEQLAIEQEMRVIKKQLPQASIFSHQDATREHFFTQSQEAHILHIATHGAFRHDNPMYSGFHLGDGWLSLQDIYQHRISAHLVVLATCESALSQGRGLDEQFGLTRGFIAAGASSILATLWPIEGQVSVKLVDHFYHFLGQGSTVARALQQAQNALRQDYPEAYYWAAFCLVGDPDWHL